MALKVYKAPYGKLLKIDSVVSDNQITAFTLRGDFFMYPEESLEKLQDFVVGQRLNKKFIQDLDDFISNNKIQVFGFRAQDIYDVLTMDVCK